MTAPQTIENRLKLTEIFLSLQGESRSSGLATVFVRLTGCPLRCVWCDSAYAFHGGAWWDIDAIVDEVREYGVPHVCVTGGEPLSQKRVHGLLTALCDVGLSVSLETSGALPIDGVDARVSRVMDLKCPDSGEVARNHYENIAHLTQHDQLKFVIGSRKDYDWAKEQIAEHGLIDRCDVFFSPVHQSIQPKQLADWIIEDRLPVRFQLQLHKQLWGDVPGK